MDERYQDERLMAIWSSKNKLGRWQLVELAFIEAKKNLHRIDREIFEEIQRILLTNPIDLDWWRKTDKEIHHDLNAFVFERKRFLPEKLESFFHDGNTSYDTEEPAFAQMLKDSFLIVEEHSLNFLRLLEEKSLMYRYVIMNARTHGQEAQLQSFGKRCLSWRQDFSLNLSQFQTTANKNLKFSKFSGAIGNNGEIDIDLERETLRLLGFEPYHGATQIMPRELYAPIAEALAQIVGTLNKIALAIRLGARSGRPILQEPFGKKQTGSSVMPHKKNTINTEQMEGMERMAEGYLGMIMQNIATWEERAIEQSCVERVAWPDLFHVTVHSLKTMNRVLEGLRVYPDNMLLEIIDSRGCYAAGPAADILKKLGISFGLSSKEAYRIVQLAAFNVFEVQDEWKKLRETLPWDLETADALLEEFQQIPRPAIVSIQEVIPHGDLRVSPQLAAEETEVERWNGILKQIFAEEENLKIWKEIFRPSHLLKNEEKLFTEVFEPNRTS